MKTQSRSLAIPTGQRVWRLGRSPSTNAGENAVVRLLPFVNLYEQITP